jgi:hypothetical protein
MKKKEEAFTSTSRSRIKGIKSKVKKIKKELIFLNN